MMIHNDDSKSVSRSVIYLEASGAASGGGGGGLCGLWGGDLTAGQAIDWREKDRRGRRGRGRGERKRGTHHLNVSDTVGTSENDLSPFSSCWSCDLYQGMRRLHFTAGS